MKSLMELKNGATFVMGENFYTFRRYFSGSDVATVTDEHGFNKPIFQASLKMVQVVV